MRLCTNCKRYPVFGSDKITGLGYCKSCQHKRTDRDKRTPLQKALDKAKTETNTVTKEPRFPKKTEVVVAEVVENNMERGMEMFDWFISQRKFMTGKCVHCGGKSQKHDDKTFHYSIAHLFPKAYFESIATHPENWLELCYYGESCHANFDNKMIAITDLNCFDEVVRKFAILYPLMTREEKRRVPSVLLTYLDAEL
jgi:hypothetical protein